MMNGMEYTGMDAILAGSFRAAIYCRLSKDDDLDGESASIANQRDMLENYCEKQGWEVVAVYQDDGYTGLNMERPDLKRMLKAIERRQINLVIKAFLSPFPSSVGKGQIDFTFSTQKPIKDMLDMTALMMCRNPSFDLFGLYSFVGNKLLNPVFSQWGNADEAQKATEQMIRGLWLTEIYRGLFNHKNGFTSEFLSQGLTNLGIIIFRIATETDGSFITSDNPVVFQKMCVTTNRCPNGIYFPLTPQFLLFLGKRTEGTINDVIFRTVGNNDVREINRVILNGAQKAIVSTNKHLGYIL